MSKIAHKLGQSTPKPTPI